MCILRPQSRTYSNPPTLPTILCMSIMLKSADVLCGQYTEKRFCGQYRTKSDFCGRIRYRVFTTIKDTEVLFLTLKHLCLLSVQFYMNLYRNLILESWHFSYHLYLQIIILTLRNLMRIPYFHFFYLFIIYYYYYFFFFFFFFQKTPFCKNKDYIRNLRTIWNKREFTDNRDIKREFADTMNTEVRYFFFFLNAACTQFTLIKNYRQYRIYLLEQSQLGQKRSVLVYFYVLLLADTIHILNEVADNKDYTREFAEYIHVYVVVHIGITGIGRLVGENRWKSTEVVTVYYKIYKECNGFRVKILHDYHRKSSLKMQSNQY